MADVTDANFQTEVLERSTQKFVVVDLWAEWCGPCKTLGPILEKLIAERSEYFELAKVDVDANPGVGQAFRVQSIPAVFALRDQNVVATFVGAQSEEYVAKWLDSMAPVLSEADLLVDNGDEASLRAALELQPDHVEATLALAELIITNGNKDEALRLLARIPETPEVRHLLALARRGDELRTDGSEVSGKLDALLAKVKTDDAARQEFIDLLELLGPTDERTSAYRKKLTSALF